MSAIKDVTDLYRADPDKFATNMERLRDGATPGSEWLAHHPGTRAAAIGPDKVDEPSPPEQSVFNPARARVTLAQLEAPPEPDRFIVDGLIPSDVGVINGPGGTGKTSLLLSESVHVLLGMDLYGREVLRPGPVLYLTQEDSRGKLLNRLSRIVAEMNLSPGERERIGERFYIEDLEEHRVRFVESDERGNLRQTDLADQLINQYADVDLSLMLVDPLIYFGAGERHMNDGAAELMLTGRRIARALECAVQFVHHCSIQASRDKTDDQYAGRSAAAIADNARFVRNLWPYASSDGEKFGGPPPVEVSSEDIAQGRLLVLKSPKISDAPRITKPTWILRQGWAFSHIENTHRSRDEIDREDARRLCDYITAEERRDLWHTAKSLEDATTDVGMARNRMRAVVRLSQQRGWVISQEVPKGHSFRHGKRTHRLAVGVYP